MNAKRHSHAFDPCHVARQTWYANCCIDTQQKTAVISELRIISRSNLVRVNSFGPVKFIMRVSYSVLKFRISYSDRLRQVEDDASSPRAMDTRQQAEWGAEADAEEIMVIQKTHMRITAGYSSAATNRDSSRPKIPITDLTSLIHDPSDQHRPQPPSTVLGDMKSLQSARQLARSHEAADYKKESATSLLEGFPSGPPLLIANTPARAENVAKSVPQRSPPRKSSANQTYHHSLAPNPTHRRSLASASHKRFWSSSSEPDNKRKARENFDEAIAQKRRRTGSWH